MTKKDAPELDAAEAEASGATGGKDITVGELTLTVPRKFKRLKVLKLLSREDLFGAILVVFGEEIAEQLEELDLDDVETVKFMEDFAIAAAGVDRGNLPSSQG
jgi:hypothetical protein